MSSIPRQQNQRQPEAPFSWAREHLKNPLYSSTYLLMLNQGVSAGLGFLYWMAAARFYPAEVVGKSSAIISTVLLLAMLAELSLKSAMQRFVPRAGEQAAKLILLAYGVSLLSAGLLAAGFFAANSALHFSDSLFAGMSSSSLALLGLAGMLWVVFFIQDGVLMGLHQTGWVLLENTIYNISKLVLLAIGYSGLLSGGIVASWFIPTTLTVLLVNVLIFARFIPRFKSIGQGASEPVSRRELVTSVAGDHLGTILVETGTRLLPLLVVSLISAEANAFFYQAWLISSMVYALAGNVAASFTVEVAPHRGQIDLYSRKAMRHMLVMILPTLLALLIAAPFILQIYGPNYARQGATLLRWLALAALPYSLNAWFLGYARVRADVRSIIWNQGLQCLLTLTLSFLWMRPYGIAAIGAAWLAAQALAAALAIIQTRRIFLGGR